MNLRRRLLAVGSIIGLVALLPTSALADDAWFHDAKGDVTSSVDIHRLSLINGATDRPAVRVTVVQKFLRAGDSFTVWFDTNPGNAGPEYKAGWIANSDAFGLARVDTFKDIGTAVDCPYFRVRSGQDGPGNASHVLVPRGCLGNPGKVRISARAQRDVAKHTVTDWAPQPLHFYRWVDRT